MLKLPFPTIVKNEKINGTMISWPEFCLSKCHMKACSTGSNNDINLCSYGFNYSKLKDNIIIGGILIKNIASNKMHNKRILENPDNIISKQNYENYIKFYSKNYNIDYLEHIKFLDVEKKKIIDEYIISEQYKKDFLNDLRPEIIKGLSFVHDYKQINSTIIQNIIVLIELNYSTHGTFENKLKHAKKEELAIYKASNLLTEKLNVAKFLLNPAWLFDRSLCTMNKLHGIVLKYIRLYENHMSSKGIEYKLEGHSVKEILANPEALTVIPHTLLDNAIKYSLRKGLIILKIKDLHDSIFFSITSFGPRINEDEIDKIFSAFYRGKNAIRHEEEGSGYGLYISQMIADQHLGTKIIVEQNKTQKSGFGHETTFSILFPLKAIIL